MSVEKVEIGDATLLLRHSLRAHRGRIRSGKAIRLGGIMYVVYKTQTASDGFETEHYWTGKIGKNRLGHNAPQWTLMYKKAIKFRTPREAYNVAGQARMYRAHVGGRHLVNGEVYKLDGSAV